MNPLVSIIIPVYNVEKYLDKCIASVVNQTYTNLEIILVDDGSPDNCPVICDQWKERDPRIIVIHQENGGLSKARNEGMKLATGEFIGFVDSDDWIELNMVEALMDALFEADADIVACNYEFELKKNNINQSGVHSSERKQYSAEEALREIFYGKGIYNYVWNKLYRKKIITKVSFLEGKIYEDILWTVQTIGNARRIIIISDILYHYLYRPESLSHNVYQLRKRVLDQIEMYERRIDYIHKYFPVFEKKAILIHQNFCCLKYLEFSSNNCHFDKDGKIRRYLHRHFCRFFPVVIFDINNLKKNFARIIFWISPKAVLNIYFFYIKFMNYTSINRLVY